MSAEHAADPQRLSEVLATAIGQLGLPAEPRSAQDHLELVSVAAGIEAQARTVLEQTVLSARSAGVTWSAIGGALGISKQAVQKRFGGEPLPSASELDPNERILGPVTAFDEMAELALAGKYGWHSIGFGIGFHRVVKSGTQWDHVRISVFKGRVRSMQTAGWQVIGSAFPYTYLKRNLTTPALTEPQIQTPPSGNA